MIKSVKTENGISTVTVVCPECGREFTVKVDSAKFEQYQNGEILAQSMGLSPDDTELLISGTCQECWDAMFLYDD